MRSEFSIGGRWRAFCSGEPYFMITGAHILGPNGEVPGAPARAISISKIYFWFVVKPGPPNYLGQPVHSQHFLACRFCQSIRRSLDFTVFRANMITHAHVG